MNRTEKQRVPNSAEFEQAALTMLEEEAKKGGEKCSPQLIAAMARTFGDQVVARALKIRASRLAERKKTKKTTK